MVNNQREEETEGAIDLQRINMLHSALKDNLENKLDDLKDCINSEVGKYSSTLSTMKSDFNRHMERERAKLAQQQEELVQNREELEREWEALRHERRTLKTSEYRDGDIVCINVGGKQLAASRHTLTQCEGSLLEAMFSGRWEEGLTRDKHGTIFLDFDPYCFEKIVDFLRSKALAPPGEYSKVPDIGPDKAQCFNVLVDYLGLRHMFHQAQIIPFKWGDLHSDERLAVSDLNENIKNDTNDSGLYGVCTPAMTSGSYVWKLQYARAGVSSTFIGVVATDYPSSTTFYGWGAKGSVWFCGHKIRSSNGSPLFRPGDELTLKIDVPARRLSMRVNNGNVFSIDNINASPGLYAATELGYGGACVKLIPLKKGELDTCF